MKSKAEELKVLPKDKGTRNIISELRREELSKVFRMLQEQRKGIEALTKMHMKNRHNVHILSEGFKTLSHH